MGTVNSPKVVVQKVSDLRLRPPCPFYGMIARGTVISDNRGNGCGYESGLRPCGMEMAHKTPEWKSCKFNNPENVAYLLEVLKVCKAFPDELKPTDSNSWGGVSALGWFLLMSR